MSKPGQSFIKINRIIHFALILGLLTFLFAGFLLNDFVLPDVQLEMTALNYAGIFALFLIPAGYYVSGIFIKGIHADWSLERKLGVIQTAYIIRWAMIEGFSLLSVVIFIVQGDSIHFYFAVAGIIILVSNGLTREKLRLIEAISDEELSKIS